MAVGLDPEGLAEKRYVTVILRLLIDRRGRLIHGEVADLEGKTQSRFSQWRELSWAVRTGLAQSPP